MTANKIKWAMTDERIIAHFVQYSVSFSKRLENSDANASHIRKSNIQWEKRKTQTANDEKIWLPIVVIIRTFKTPQIQNMYFIYLSLHMQPRLDRRSNQISAGHVAKKKSENRFFQFDKFCMFWKEKIKTSGTSIISVKYHR